MRTSPLEDLMTTPHLPRPLALVARPLPLTPLSLALTALTRRIVRHHPSMLRRLGAHAAGRFLLDPTDLPFVLLLEPCADAPRVTAHRRGRLPAHGSRIAGPFSAFLAMMHGAEDGDALFFSRDLVIEGDTEAVLALRNAIDDAELDLTEELVTLGGPFAAALRRVTGLVERQTGLSLHRAELPGMPS